jgi:hypothetical protein
MERTPHNQGSSLQYVSHPAPYWRLGPSKVAHLTEDNYQRYTRENNLKALEPYQCDTNIDGTIIIHGERYVTEEVLDSFDK